MGGEVGVDGVAGVLRSLSDIEALQGDERTAGGKLEIIARAGDGIRYEFFANRTDDVVALTPTGARFGTQAGEPGAPIEIQPREVVMAPCGHLHFHPRTSLYRDDFDAADVGSQGLFLHEMTHVWQTQTRGRFYLPLMRHPFCRYRYSFEPGKPFAHYGLEQQGELVRHAFLLGRGVSLPGAPPLDELRRVLPFGA